MSEAISTTAAGTVPFAERARDRGLVRGIGVAGLTAAIVNGVVGAGIFKLPATMSVAVGGYAPLAYVACAVAMGAVVLCFAEGGSRVPTSGGTYGYVEAAFGPMTGFVVGMLLWLSTVLACGGILSALAETALKLAPALAPFRSLLIVAVIGGFAWVNALGVRSGTRFVAGMTIAKLVPLAVFVVVGGLFAGGAPAPASAPTPTIDPSTFGRGIILALFAFSGMETSVGASGEVARPTRTVPIALLAAMGFVLLLYVGIQLVAERLLGGALGSAAAPLAEGLGRIDPRLGTLLLIGTIVSMAGWIAGDLLGGPRFLYAFGRDRLLPAALGRLQARSKAPAIAIVTHAIIAGALALTGTFEQLAVLASLASCGIYSLACAAAWVLRRRGVATLGAPLGFRILPAAAIVGIASMVVILFLARWAEIAGFFAVIMTSIVIYFAGAPARRTPA